MKLKLPCLSSLHVKQVSCARNDIAAERLVLSAGSSHDRDCVNRDPASTVQTRAFFNPTPPGTRPSRCLTHCQNVHDHCLIKTDV